MKKILRVERKGNEVHVYMSQMRSHFSPDNIEGIKVGDVVYFHVTNLEQDWDVPHGFAVKGNNNSEFLIMPGQTRNHYLDSQENRNLSILLYRFLFCAASGNAGIY